MTDFKRFAVIKTGWCDSYTGDEPVGNFRYLENALGAERFNMLPTPAGFKIYCLPSAPTPSNPRGWTIAHVAVDPADRKMKLVGWYEEATFKGKYLRRTIGGTDRSVGYCIVAKRAFEIPPALRPVLDHGRQLGSTRIGWLRGEETTTDWSIVARRLQGMIAANKSVASDQTRYRPADQVAALGETARPAKNLAGILLDDGGVPYGRNSVAESEEHKALKAWACENPAFFGATTSCPGTPEFDLPSGDKIDAVHIGAGDIWLIEGKSRRSGEKDLERGIYQCVKYRAVYEAMQSGSRERLTVHAVLLTEIDLSDRLTKLARRHRVRTLTHFCKVPE